MMRISALFLILFLALALSACGDGRPAIALEAERLDLGQVPNGEIVSREVMVANDGDGPLQVEAVTTSCGCTTATLEPMQIAPGASGRLTITFDSGAHGPELTGPLVRQVFINSNDPATPQAMIELAAEITPPATETLSR